METRKSTKCSFKSNAELRERELCACIFSPALKSFVQDRSAEIFLREENFFLREVGVGSCGESFLFLQESGFLLKKNWKF